MTLAIQNIDETLKSLVKLQEETEKAVKEAGEALKIYIEKSSLIHSNRSIGQTMKLPIVIKDGVATPSDKKPLKKSERKSEQNGTPKEKKLSLKGAIKTVLARSSTGIKVGEILDVIENEQLWVTDKDNLGGQLQSNLFAMKKAGVVDRNKDGLYSLVVKTNG